MSMVRRVVNTNDTVNIVSVNVLAMYLLMCANLWFPIVTFSCYNKVYETTYDDSLYKD